MLIYEKKDNGKVLWKIIITAEWSLLLNYKSKLKENSIGFLKVFFIKTDYGLSNARTPRT